MPRRLDSVNQGGYVEAIDIVERDLEAVVAMLDIADARKLEAARVQIVGALDLLHGVLEGGSDVLGGGADVVPVAAVGELEAVDLLEVAGVGVAAFALELTHPQ